MRGMHRYQGRPGKRGPRLGRVAFVLSLALVISQSLGMIAANAFGPKTFGAWGSQSTSGSNTSGGGRVASTGGASTSYQAEDRTRSASTGPQPAPPSPGTGANISTDLVAAGPFTYNHSTLAGTGPNLPWYDSRTISKNAGVVESLEGGDFKCGDLVLFFVKVEVTGGSGSRDVALDLSFLKEPTGQPGVGFDDIVGASLSTNDSGSGGGNANLEGNETVSLSNEHDGTVGGKDAILGTVTITNLNPDDELVAAVWAHLGCEVGASPTGNLQTALMDASSTNNDDNFSNGGQQTIPFKKIEDIAQPGLEIVKAASSSQVTAGAAFTYTITVKNTGNVQATGVVITDDLADSLTGVSAGFDVNPGSPGGTGSCTVGAGNTISCAVGILAANDGLANGPDEVVVTINATAPNTCGELSNTATVDSDQTSPQTSNGVTVTIVGCAPTLSITKEAQSANGQPITTIPLGGSFNYVITVTNTGNASASPVIVTDDLNDSLAINSTSWDVDPPDTGTDGACSVGAGNTVSCPSSGTITLAASDGSANGTDTLQVVINVTVPENLTSCPTLTNSAQARIGVEGTPSSAQSAPVTVTGCASNLTIAKQGPATVGQGGAVTYTITVKNTGNAQATGVFVTDDLADSLTGVSASFDIDPGSGSDGSCTVTAGNNVSCSVGTLAANDGGANGPDEVVVTINATAPVGQCPTITNQATLTASGQELSINSNIVTTVVTGCGGGGGGGGPTPAGIQVLKGGPAVAHVGDTITYTFAVSLAPGSATLTNITLTDPICSTTPTLVSKTGGDQDTALETGETWNYRCNHVVTATDPDPLPNTVTVTGTGPNGQVSDTDTHSVDIIHPAIRIVKTAKPGSIGPGETVTYTYEVTNTGDVTLFDVKVTDNKLGNICTIGRLDVGETQTCTADFTASSDFGGPLDNVGKARGQDVTGKSVQDTDQASIDVVLGTTVTPVTPPSGLAFTGASGVLQIAGVALLLLLLGSGILFFTRRRDAGTEA
jgi:uncharacterized repeat protein (TIGR01451 family)/fimbrial isopeptide formation D2 family protein